MLAIESAVAKAVGAKTRRLVDRSAWWCEREELEQAARLAALDAGQRCDGEGYLVRAAGLAVGKHLLHMGSPVSASDHYRSNLIGLFGAEVPDALATADTRPDEWLEREEMRREVRRWVCLLLASRPELRPGVEVLMGEPVALVAASAGITVPAAKSAAARTRGILRHALALVLQEGDR